MTTRVHRMIETLTRNRYERKRLKMLQSRGHGESKRELTPEEFQTYRSVEEKYMHMLADLSNEYERRKDELNQAFWKEADEAVVRIRRQKDSGK